ncbi:MAG TPA: hypothetical protein VII13_19485 [Vicinamibacteria bacterium]|jgi:hypothetical protein
MPSLTALLTAGWAATSGQTDATTHLNALAIALAFTALVLWWAPRTGTRPHRDEHSEDRAALWIH